MKSSFEFSQRRTSFQGAIINDCLISIWQDFYTNSRYPHIAHRSYSILRHKKCRSLKNTHSSTYEIGVQLKYKKWQSFLWNKKTILYFIILNNGQFSKLNEHYFTIYTTYKICHLSHCVCVYLSVVLWFSNKYIFLNNSIVNLIRFAEDNVVVLRFWLLVRHQKVRFFPSARCMASVWD